MGGEGNDSRHMATQRPTVARECLRIRLTTNHCYKSVNEEGENTNSKDERLNTLA